jgi:hypothetical protein
MCCEALLLLLLLLGDKEIGAFQYFFVRLLALLLSVVIRVLENLFPGFVSCRKFPL